MTSENNNLESVHEQAEELASEGHLAEALLAYEEVREHAESDPTIYKRLGDLREAMGERKSALEDYKLAVSAFTIKGAIAKALGVAKKVLLLDPAMVDILDQISALCIDPDEETAESRTPTLPKETPAEAAASGSFPETPLFSSLPQLELIDVVNSANHISLKRGEYVFKHGDEGRSVYIITWGSAEAISYTSDNEEVQCATFSAGDFFGEFGYFSGGNRTASIRATTEYLELLELTRNQLKRLTGYHQKLGKVLFNFYKDRVLDRLLTVSDIFKHLTSEDRETVLARVWPEVFVEEMEIVTEGDAGEEMYLIKTGSVEVSTGSEDGFKNVIATLSEGDCFGELALVLGTVRSATVTALTDVEVVVFSRPVLEDILAKYSETNAFLKKMAKEHSPEIEELHLKLPPSIT
ncbi:MAG: cyclic nucleotide-binding domain-containing protein [Thermodesulfobacteriota bacterium]